jgi:hypothetical protein
MSRTSASPPQQKSPHFGHVTDGTIPTWGKRIGDCAPMTVLIIATMISLSALGMLAALANE